MHIFLKVETNHEALNSALTFSTVVPRLKFAKLLPSIDLSNLILSHNPVDFFVQSCISRKGKDQPYKHSYHRPEFFPNLSFGSAILISFPIRLTFIPSSRLYPQTCHEERHWKSYHILEANVPQSWGKINQRGQGEGEVESMLRRMNLKLSTGVGASFVQKRNYGFTLIVDSMIVAITEKKRHVVII